MTPGTKKASSVFGHGLSPTPPAESSQLADVTHEFDRDPDLCVSLTTPSGELIHYLVISYYAIADSPVWKNMHFTGQLCNTERPRIRLDGKEYRLLQLSKVDPDALLLIFKILHTTTRLRIPDLLGFDELKGVADICVNYGIGANWHLEIYMKRWISKFMDDETVKKVRSWQDVLDCLREVTRDLRKRTAEWVQEIQPVLVDDLPPLSGRPRMRCVRETAYGWTVGRLDHRMVPGDFLGEISFLVPSKIESKAKFSIYKIVSKVLPDHVIAQREKFLKKILIKVQNFFTLLSKSNSGHPDLCRDDLCRSEAIASFIRYATQNDLFYLLYPETPRKWKGSIGRLLWNIEKIELKTYSKIEYRGREPLIETAAPNFRPLVAGNVIAVSRINSFLAAQREATFETRLGRQDVGMRQNRHLTPAQVRDSFAAAPMGNKISVDAVSFSGPAFYEQVYNRKLSLKWRRFNIDLTKR